MFQLFLPTIIRQLRSLTKVTLVIYVYDVNGMMAACRLLYTMVLDVVLPVFRVSFVSCKDTGKTGNTISCTINDMLPSYHSHHKHISQE